ncbi:MAG: cytochrome c4 [Gammaproteobacteria bacterium]|nr:cytochrome c4 [Gammaproteobacteria bacterium]MDE1886917.1 cytochrome c4 [Gammaproteobacteria bacterium]MDE2022932.1 cytochrome c4 [Gammaproteobacteria bacterium]MDE2140334.1 cytochrome c4 [Gammaproteobacteria bacterium]MDE2274252.1 cytochrome c4 [Gammaproteobacteria bacterium]
MNKWVLMLAAATAVAATANAGAASDKNAAAGQAKSATCAACHGADGNSVSPQFPKLAGQNADYIVRELQRFKSGERKNAIMQPMAAPLSTQDMEDLGAWFSSQTVKPGEADPSLVKAGGAVYRGGDIASGVPACLACHGPDGAGNGPMLIPALAGQHAAYVVNQLQAFADGSRKSPMMDTIAARLTPAQMQAVASYIQGLHYAPIRP